MIVAARIIGFIVAFLVLPGLALAHGPTRQKAVESVEIDAAPDKVWSKIAEFGDLAWHPRIDSATASTGNEKGSIRTLTFKQGGTMEEELSKYDAAKMSYASFIGHVNVELLPATNYSSTITVKPLDDGARSEVTWKAAFYRGDPNGEPPANLNDEASIAGVTAYLREGLDNLKAVVESGS